MIQFRSALAVALTVISVSAAAETQPKLAVMELRSDKDTAQLASAVSGVLGNEVQRLGVFEVITADQVRALISLERQKALLGGDEGQGAAAVGNMLSADYLISGEVNKLNNGKEGTLFSLQLLLLDAKSGKRLNSELVKAKSEGELVSHVSDATVRLCSKALEGRTGMLYVASNEADASVKVDSVIKGTTPLPGQMEVGAGPHILEVEKQGFVLYKKEIRVKPGERDEEQVTLVPSPDFIKDYEAKASRMRVGAYVATGLAVAGFAGAGYFQYRNTQKYGSLSDPQSFVYAQDQVRQGNEDYRARAGRLAAEIQDGTKFGLISAGVGFASAVTATYLFIAGDSPGKYNRYEVMGVSLAPMPQGGGYASMSVRF